MINFTSKSFPECHTRWQRIDVGNYIKLWLKIHGIYLKTHKLISRRPKEGPVAFNGRVLRHDRGELGTEGAMRARGIKSPEGLFWTGSQEQRGVDKIAGKACLGSKIYWWNQGALGPGLDPTSAALDWVPRRVGSHVPEAAKSTRLRVWSGWGEKVGNYTLHPWGQCCRQLGKVHERRGVCCSPRPEVIVARRNGDAMQALAFKQGGGDRKICRQQMWKEKESSGTRRMVWWVQV